MSLERRLEKITALKSKLELEGKMPKVDLGEFASAITLDEFDDDEMLACGENTADDYGVAGCIDIKALASAIAIESTSLPALVSQVSNLLEAGADAKIARSIALAEEHIAKGDKVLLFSRYTDTVNALMAEFNSRHDPREIVYGIYVGPKSAIYRDGIEKECAKRDIKEQLASGDLQLMFCSDAASEGLNLQAARVLINVDVPWTPARLEQRIGRVARLGQRAESVDIYNVWYPDSIEARMYRRISKRLKEANIAVGEFPDVVADGIKNVVLEGREQDDDSLEALQEIRNAAQTRALGELWSTRDGDATTSRHVRDCLMEVCDQEFERIWTSDDGELRTYLLPDGEITLTALEGMSETVSMKSRPWRYVDYDLDDFGYLNDSLGNPCVFVRKADASSWIDQEYLTDMLMDDVIPAAAISDAWPKMLPSASRLSLEYAVDCELPRKPEFWPPIC